MPVKIFALSVIALCAIIVIVSMLRSGHTVKALILTALQGVAALFAVNIIGMLTGVTLSVNWYTLGTGAVFGTPGIISMLLLDVLFSK